jgi:dynein heavy chain
MVLASSGGLVLDHLEDCSASALAIVQAAAVLQGIRWIVKREEPNSMTIIQQSQKGYIDKVISCIENGRPLLIENLPDDIDAVLDPVVGKTTMRRGANLVVKIGDNEVDYDRNFRLYLQTKLSNPHYKPEINAQVPYRL